MLKVKCHICGKSIRGGDDWAGMTAKCPNCDAELVFPAARDNDSEAVSTEPIEINVNPVVSVPPTKNGVFASEIAGIENFGFERDKSQPRFPALRVLARTYEFLAIAIFVMAIVFIAMSVISAGYFGFQGLLSALIFAILVLLLTAAVTVTLLCGAQFIRLALQIEENTRKAALALDNE